MNLDKSFAAQIETRLPSLDGLWLMGGAVPDVNDLDIKPNILTATYYGTVKPYYSNSSERNFLSAEGTGTGISLSSDGQYVYSCGNSLDQPLQIKLGEPNNVFSMGDDRVLVDTRSEQNTLYGVEVSKDGNYFYLVGTSGDKITQYSLAKKNRLDQRTFVEHFAVGAWEANPYEVRFSKDGLKFFVFGFDGVLYGFSRPSQANFTGATQDQALDIKALVGSTATLRGFNFDNTGTKLFVTGEADDLVHQISLTSVYTLSGAIHDGSLNVSVEEGSPYSVTVTNDNRFLVVYGSSGDDFTLYEISQELGFTGLIDYSNEIALAEDNSFALVSENDGLKLSWSGGALSKIATSAGTMTHFIARFGSNFAIGTITATGGGGDLEFVSTDIAVNDVIEIDNFSVKLNGMIA